MKSPTPEQIEKWISAGEKLVKSPIGGLVLNAIAGVLPKAGITPEQLAGMKARAADATQREARARARTRAGG